MLATRHGRKDIALFVGLTFTCLFVSLQNRVNTLENQLVEIIEQQRLENQRLNKERDNAIGLLQQVRENNTINVTSTVLLF